MSLHSYHYSVRLGQEDPPFSSLIMAAMRKADTNNLSRLRGAFPEIWEEFERRYHARQGVLPEDGPIDLELLATQVRAMMRGVDEES